MSLRNFTKQKWELHTSQLLVAKQSLCFKLLWEARCYYRPRTYSDLCSESAETIESDTATELGVSKMSLIRCKAQLRAEHPEPEAGGGLWLSHQSLSILEGFLLLPVAGDAARLSLPSWDTLLALSICWSSVRSLMSF